MLGDRAGHASAVQRSANLIAEGTGGLRGSRKENSLGHEGVDQTLGNQEWCLHLLVNGCVVSELYCSVDLRVYCKQWHSRKHSLKPLSFRFQQGLPSVRAKQSNCVQGEVD